MDIQATVQKLDNGFILQAFGENTALENSIGVVSSIGEKLNDAFKDLKEGEMVDVQISVTPVAQGPQVI